jgi:hypothetical protein
VRSKSVAAFLSLSLEPEGQNQERASSDDRLVSRVRALLERVKALTGDSQPESEPDAPKPCGPEPDAPSVPWDNPKVQQLYALQLGMSDLLRRVVRGRRDSLAGRVGPETADLIAQLVACEEKLSEASDSFWGDQEEADGLQNEIAELRRKLGCSEEVADSDGE